MTTSGELFAGVGGLGMAVNSVFGTKPAWFAEFDAAPSRVLKFHYPSVPQQAAFALRLMLRRHGVPAIQKARTAA